jgi:transposase
MNNITTLGIDLAKSVFQLCGLNQANKVKFNRLVTRAKLIRAVKEHPHALIAMEACGSSHYWARTFMEMGYQVRLIPAQHVKAFCKGNKSDLNDALAIAESAHRPNIYDVSPKTIEQQDIQTLLRIRSRCKELRKGTINQVRGLLAEYGIVLPKTIIQFDRCIPGILEDAENGLTSIARGALNELYQEHRMITKKIVAYDQQLKQMAQQHSVAKQLMRIRGIGPTTSLTLFACIGNGHQFKNARQLAAWIGLVPRHFGSGGKAKLGPISKRGNTYLRTLLIHGARTVMNWMKNKHDSFSIWGMAVMNRRGKHKAIVAVANKTARMIWVLLNKGIDAVPKQHLSAVS